MVGNPPVAVGPGVVGVQLDGFVVVLYGPPVLAQAMVGITPVVVGQGVIGVQFYCLIVVLYGPSVLAQAMVGITPAAVDPGVVRVQLDGLGVVGSAVLGSDFLSQESRKGSLTAVVVG
jgi:hypothetical protein